MSNTTPTTSQLSQNALYVHLGFAVLFFGIGAVQQFTTVWFKSISLPAVGKTALLFLYTSFFFASIFSHRFVEILGVKRCFMLSTVVYAAFILTLCLPYPVVIYGTAHPMRPIGLDSLDSLLPFPQFDRRRATAQTRVGAFLALLLRRHKPGHPRIEHPERYLWFIGLRSARLD